MCASNCVGELDEVFARVLPGINKGTLFPECLGNELRLVNCSTTPGDNSTCSYVLVDCVSDSETTGETPHIDLWIIVSSAIVILIILILVIAVGVCSIVYSIWRTVHKKSTRSETQLDGHSHSHSNGNTSHHTHQENNHNDGTDDVGLNMDNPIYTKITPDNHSPHSHLSDTLEHNLINPLYDEAEEPTPLPNDTITTDNQSPPSCRLSDTPEHNLINPLYDEAEEMPPLYLTGEITEHITESIAEHQYAIPHDVTTDSSKGSEAVRYHHYEYVDSPLASVSTRSNHA